MKYFSLNCVKNAYELVSAITKDKFWGILGILYSIDSQARPGANFSINTEKLSTFLEQTFRLKDKKIYNAPSSEYSVVFANDWEQKTADNFIVNTPDVMPIIIWAYRSFAFDHELNSHELFEKFVKDFHLSKDSAEKFFNIKFDETVVEYSDNEYNDIDLFNKLGGNQTPDATTIKMNKSFVVANAGDLSRGPFFQPLYASLNTLECLIIFPFDVKEYYHVFTSPEQKLVDNTKSKCNQIIYYGAPGTGKSHIVKKRTEGESVVRTTFHPDSDYSTFVGCYKPTTKEIEMRDVTGKVIVEHGQPVTENRIIYQFVEQAFLQAYIKSWNFYAEAEDCAAPKKQFLIIEEINRGNCAQIFGDLFQLLDRNDSGFSEYFIHADKDMQKHISNAFKDCLIKESHKDTINSLYPKDDDVVAKVLSGEILLLPDNLYIWATMNTSDQSLFPIDSAFKRRWDWRFRPIVKGRDNSGKELDWKIKIGQKVCAWWDFLEKINAVIGTTTSSADKKLGFFFCKADDGIISTETFVSKVIFYLWNDVFKDYGFENSIFNDTDGSTLDFDRFYSAAADGNVVVQNEKVQLFLTNLGLTLVDVDSVDGNINNDGEVAENDGTAFEVVLDGERISEKTAIGKFLKVIEKVGIERVAQLGLQVSGNPIISRDKLAEDTPGGYGGSQKYINGYWFVTKFNNPTKRKFLMEIKEKLGVNIVVE